MDMKEAAALAKVASIQLAASSSELKNHALKQIGYLLWEKRDAIIEANRLDIEQSVEENLSQPLLKRLKFDEEKIKGVIEGINSLVELAEPVGKVLMETDLDDGLKLYRESCPIGVIGVIFESRPDALVQIASLCLKSGNAVLLKGGREALRTNKILADVIIEATHAAGLVNGWLFNITSRDEVSEMLELDHLIDLIIPRGSNSFVRYIIDNSKIPVLGHADGICHGYVHSDADIDMAVNVINDSKTQYVAVCNALETLLVHEAIAKDFLPKLALKLKESNVVIHGCNRTQAIIPCELATEEDWKTEYLDYEIAIKIVATMEDAIEHINTYGSGHTEAIITQNDQTAHIFMMLVDSGNVFHNCSTRFSDGFKYGFGAEVGISTNKIHARGPVGLDGLVIYKYKLFGKGQIVGDYATGKETFKHNYIQG
jgi:glutamate-5-semialdehyde dehydrogenase